MKICPVGAELFHANGWTDRQVEANCRFSQFCEHVQKSTNIYRDIIVVCCKNQAEHKTWCSSTLQQVVHASSTVFCPAGHAYSTKWVREIFRIVVKSPEREASRSHPLILQRHSKASERSTPCQSPIYLERYTLLQEASEV
jgi:hypothetical protein